MNIALQASKDTDTLLEQKSRHCNATDHPMIIMTLLPAARQAASVQFNVGSRGVPNPNGMIHPQGPYLHGRAV